MKRFPLTLLLSFGVLFGAAPRMLRAAPPDPAALEHFERKVRPLLAEKCFGCHGPKVQQNALRLDSRAAVLKGGVTGPAVRPDAPDDSPLLQAVRYTGAVKMPPTGKLSPAEIAALETWVKAGAPWPEKQGTGKKPPTSIQNLKSKIQNRPWWSFVPVKPVAPPKVKSVGWVRNPVDAFVLAELEKKGLKPAPEAARRTLLRRLSFDLTGLPPTPAELDAFLADRSSDAYEKVVDQLLASPRYGERWGRHWLDVARYVDSLDARGLGGEGDIADAWRYRDWVINSLNKDLPFNQFLTYQIAGDLLPAENGSGFNRDGVIATTFLSVGNWGNGDADKDKILTDIVDDQIDAVGKAFLGLTVSCARCHDHKFDPISQKDYYGLAGIFFSTHILPKLTPKGAGETPLRVPLVSKEELAERARRTARIAELEKTIREGRDKAVAEWVRGMLPQTERYVVAAWEAREAQSVDAAQAFARERGLHPYALRQWRDFLGFGGYPLMTNPVANVAGKTCVFAYNRNADTPSVLVNASDSPQAIASFVLPPNALSVHPGPTDGVVVGWRSPVTGRVRLAGTVKDIDPNCGDGIAWRVEVRSGNGSRPLASGELPNGGEQTLEKGTGGGALAEISVRAGDTVHLLILPKNGHSCDTTQLTLTFAEVGGGKTWDLIRDVAGDLHRGNPHPDALGNPDVWSFADMAGAGRGQGAASAPALTAWHEAAARLADTPERNKAVVEEAAREIQKRLTAVDASNPFWLHAPPDEALLPDAVRTNLATLRGELDALRKEPMPPLEYANGAQEGGVPESPHAGVHDVKVHLRGRYDRLGELVPRRFPLVLAGQRQTPLPAAHSGRLELARWLASPSHPLTARVAANRAWQGHFGRGLVATSSNLGKLGELPTHPALLDWLAGKFCAPVEKGGLGWSLKGLHRLLVTSATYRQSTAADAKTLAADPGNRLWGRTERRRLEWEALRDALLAASGMLDETKRGGVGDRNFNAPRRSVYLMTVRSDRTGFGPLFDAADSTQSVERRVVSTVAPQALWMLNHPFAQSAADALARRLRDEAHDTDARLRRVYLLLYARPPTARELAVGRTFLNRARPAPGVRPAAAPDTETERAAWTAYAHVLLCANEFLYVD